MMFRRTLCRAATARALLLATLVSLGACAGTGVPAMTGAGGDTATNTGGASATGGVSGGAGTSTGAGGATNAAGSNGGAGASTAGGAGGGGVMTGDFFGASRCAGADTKVCDGFEDGGTGAAPNPALWSLLGGGHVSLDATQAARGKQSVKVSGGQDYNSRALLVNTSAFPATNNSFFVRFFVRLTQPLPDGHVTFLDGQGTLAGKNVDVRLGGQFKILVANYFGGDQNHTSALPMYMYQNGTSLMVARWTCIEAYYGGGMTNEMRVWLDDQEIMNLHVTDWGDGSPAPWAPQYQSIELGWENYGAGTGNDLWLDEIAIDDKRIGCTR